MDGWRWRRRRILQPKRNVNQSVKCSWKWIERNNGRVDKETERERQREKSRRRRRSEMKDGCTLTKRGLILAVEGVRMRR
jgi:cbb3-type cytochrome oxidase cytochrome c subunit